MLPLRKLYLSPKKSYDSAWDYLEKMQIFQSDPLQWILSSPTAYVELMKIMVR